MDGLGNATQGTRPRTRDISPCVRHTHMRNRTWVCHRTDAPLAPMRMLCGHRGQSVRNGHGRRHIHAGIAGNRRTSEARRTGDMGGMTEGDGSETSGHISRFGNRHMAKGGRTADMHALRANATDEPVWHNANTGTDGRWRGCSVIMMASRAGKPPCGEPPKGRTPEEKGRVGASTNALVEHNTRGGEHPETFRGIYAGANVNTCTHRG